MNLQELLSEAADGLEDVESATGPAGDVVWSRGGRPFAVLNLKGSAAEFGLDATVAAAAARTRDVVPSPRGQGWVLFRPSVVDRHAADRASAWFASAYRRVGGA